MKNILRRPCFVLAGSLVAVGARILVGGGVG